MKGEDIVEAAKQYLTELQKEADELLKEMQAQQRKYNSLLRQIQGLTWFVDPTHDEEVKSEILFPQKPTYVSDAKTVKDAVAEILKATYPESVHYEEIMVVLDSKGYVIPGKDPKQNLLSYLSRDDRFVRDESVRGKYKFNPKFMEAVLGALLNRTTA